MTPDRTDVLSGVDVSQRLRRVALLGAFEMPRDSQGKRREGLILGSRKELLGFVLETNREAIEQIITLSALLDPAFGPPRMAAGIVPALERLGAVALRLELKPLGGIKAVQNGGAVVHGALVYRDTASKLQRLALTAIEAIHVALASRLPLLADSALLQIDVAPLLGDAQVEEGNEEDFKAFVANVTATDFTNYLRRQQPDNPGPDATT